MKKCISMLCMTMITTLGYSQQEGKFRNAVTDVSIEAKTWLDPLITFLWIMVGIIGVYGIFKIYGKIQTGDQDTGKSIAQWVGGIVFIIIAVFFLKSLQN